MDVATDHYLSIQMSTGASSWESLRHGMPQVQISQQGYHWSYAGLHFRSCECQFALIRWRTPYYTRRKIAHHTF
jgi:hypothetical protein